MKGSNSKNMKKKKNTKVPETAQQAFLIELIRALGGPKKTAEFVAEKTGEFILPYNFSNWRDVHGAVPLKHCILVSKALRISPYLLNYEAMTKFNRKEEDWKELLEEVKILTLHQKQKILKYRLPEVEEVTLTNWR